MKTPEQPKMMVRPTVTEKNGRLRQGAPIRYDAGGGSYTGAAERVMGGCGRILVGVMGVVAVAGRRWG